MLTKTVTDPLLTDEYALKMAQSYWRAGSDRDQVSFELFARELPRERDFLVATGIADALEFLRNLHFEEEDIVVLRGLGHYEEGFLRHLTGLDSKVLKIRAIREGTRINAETPIMTVTGPRILGTLIEPALLAIIGHQTMVASKAARIVAAADGRPVWDFSMRRLHGLGAAVPTARAAYIAGCAGTATTAAARLGIPTTGTMAHAYVQSYGDREQEAFEQFLLDYPAEGVLLVDTYDTPRGIERAIQAAVATGITPKAVRIDSGDLGEQARLARTRLDDEGLTTTDIILTGDLNEEKIRKLVGEDVPVDVFGVGTQLGTSADAPNLGVIYKLVEQEIHGEHQFVMKTSPGKITDPGLHQVWRNGDRDLLAMIDEIQDGEPLLQPVDLNGPSEPIEAVRARAILEPCPPPLGKSDVLEECRRHLIAKAKRKVAPV